MIEEYISKEKYDYEMRSLAESLVGIAKNLDELKDEVRDLKRKLFTLETFGPLGVNKNE